MKCWSWTVGDVPIIRRLQVDVPEVLPIGDEASGEWKILSGEFKGNSNVGVGAMNGYFYRMFV